MRVKICGITNLEDALLAEALGAYALGFNFYPKSPRYITPHDALKIIEKLNTPISVGVFVNASAAEIFDVIHTTGIDCIQLHGDEDANFCANFSCPIIKALRPTNKVNLHLVESFLDIGCQILIDAPHKTLYGGSGMHANWEIAADLAKKHKIILAGGLSAENVSSAVRLVKPYMLDVCSGVEEGLRKKSKDKMQEFFCLKGDL